MAPFTFTPSQCALFGAGAAVAVLLVSLTVTQLPRSRARQITTA
jgi:hypothetical protein